MARGLSGRKIVQMKKQVVELPPLAFGDQHASSFDNFSDYADFLSGAFKLDDVAPTNRATEGFSGRVSVFSFGSIAGAACSASAVTFIEKDAQSLCVDFKLAGASSLVVDGKTMELRKGQIALFPPHQQCLNDMSRHSSVAVKISQSRLLQTVRAMCAAPEAKLEAPGQPQVLEAPASGLLTPVLKSAFSLIDDCKLSTPLLERLNVEDMIYRALSLALFPQLIVECGDRPEKSGRDNRTVELICELIRQNPTRWVSMTEMEAAANLTGRAIQLAFQKRFGAPPIAWQRQEKLRLVREALLTGRISKIASVAADFGFANPSKFAAHYAREFGELPSETLKKR